MGRWNRLRKKVGYMGTSGNRDRQLEPRSDLKDFVDGVYNIYVDVTYGHSYVALYGLHG